MTPERPSQGVGHYLRDIIYGSSDGVVTTLAIVAGTAGAGFPAHVGLILGLTKIAADGLSMGASNYLGLKSELEQTGGSIEHEQPWRHALATIGAFLVAGAMPLLCYFAPASRPTLQLVIALVLSGITLAFIGAARSIYLAKKAWVGAVEMLVVAGGASGVAYGLGVLGEQVLR